MAPPEKNLETARRYLESVGQPDQDASVFFADDVVQVEFLTFRDGKIVRQHNYDCFDSW